MCTLLSSYSTNINIKVHGKSDPSLKFGQNVQSKVKPEVIAKLYKDWIIPLTKKVEIDYLLRRLEDEDVELVEKYKK